MGGGIGRHANCQSLQSSNSRRCVLGQPPSAALGELRSPAGLSNAVVSAAIILRDADATTRFLDVRDAIYLDQRIARDSARGGDGSPHRRILAEAAFIGFVHAIVVFEVVEIDVD